MSVIQNKRFSALRSINFLWFVIVGCFSLIYATQSVQQFDASKINQQIQMRWSFISQIQHTWFKNIINKYFQNCQQLKQIHALYNCNTTLQNYQPFWAQFIEGIFLIKFKQQPENSDKKSIHDLLIQASKQWILVNKTQAVIPIQDAYDDVHKFPSNIMQFAQFSQNYQDQFDQLVKIINWQRPQKQYLSKRGKSQQQIQKDQAIILKKYFPRQCFALQNYKTQCKMPLQRFSYYLKQIFFYYFQQPQQHSKFNEKTNQIIVKPLLNYRITKLWRDMRTVMINHIGFQKEVTFEDVQTYSIEILQSVMESLMRRRQQGRAQPQNNEETNENQQQPQKTTQNQL